MKKSVHFNSVTRSSNLSKTLTAAFTILALSVIFSSPSHADGNGGGYSGEDLRPHTIKESIDTYQEMNLDSVENAITKCGYQLVSQVGSIQNQIMLKTDYNANRLPNKFTKFEDTWTIPDDNIILLGAEYVDRFDGTASLNKINIDSYQNYNSYYVLKIPAYIKVIKKSKPLYNSDTRKYIQTFQGKLVIENDITSVKFARVKGLLTDITDNQGTDYNKIYLGFYYDCLKSTLSEPQNLN